MPAWQRSDCYPRRGGGPPLVAGVIVGADDAGRFAVLSAELLRERDGCRTMGDAALQYLGKVLSWETAVEAVFAKSILSQPISVRTKPEFS